MAYVHAQDDQVVTFPYTIGQLRSDNPNTSFPKRIPEHVLTTYGVFEVVVESAPAVDEKNYKSVRAEIPALVDGKWRLLWSVAEKTPEEKQTYSDAMAKRTRAKRDDLLAATDYLALSDTTLTPEMAAYRQALRDITTHPNFPYLQEGDWPNV